MLIKRIALALVLGFIIAEVIARLIVFSVQPYTDHLQGFKNKYLMTNEITNDDIVIIGDSVINNAVSPEYLEFLIQDVTKSKIKSLKLKVHNLASPSQDPYTFYLLLKKIIYNQNVKPRAILINANPDFMVRNYVHFVQSDERLYDEHLRVIHGESSYNYRCEVLKPVSFNQKRDCISQRHSYLLRHQPIVKLWMKSFLRAILNPYNDKLDSFRKISTGSPQGWYPLFKIDQGVGDDIKMFSEPVKLDETNFLTPIAKLTSDNKIPLVLVNMPYLGADDDSRFLKDIVDNKHIYLINLSTQLQQNKYFYDHKHLNVAGAIHFTEMLSAQMLNLPNRVLRE